MEESTLYKILGSLQVLFVASFILSIKAFLKPNLTYFIKYFFIYPSVALIMIVFLWLDFFKITNKGFFSDLNFFSLVFHFTFLTWFILTVIKSLGPHLMEKMTRVIFLVIIFASVLHDYLNFSQHSYVLVNGLLFIFCLFYFNKLFKLSPYIHLISEPSFWIITGIFVGMGMTLPFYIFHEFILQRVTKKLFNVLGLIGGSGYAIMHLFFIKGLLCALNSKNLREETLTAVKVNKIISGGVG